MTVRHWAFRGIALLLGFSPLLVLEGILRTCDWPNKELRSDPLLDLHALRPLFTLSADGLRREIGPERRNWFCPDEFPVKKGRDTFRIFVLGGSTVQGEPYQKESAFSTWLKLQLTAAEPTRNWEVVNCGGLSYASYRVAVILEEVLEYQPDLIILYTGHNEFLEDRTYRGLKELPRPLAKAISFLRTLKTFQAIDGWVNEGASEKFRDPMPQEVSARLDHQGGLDRYVRDTDWRSGVINHYRLTMERMLAACRKRGVPLMLCVPVSNLRDTPPFKIAVDPTLSASQQSDFLDLWNQLLQGGQLSEGKSQREICEQLLTIDPHHAGAAYLQGRLQLEAGEVERAEYYFRVARDWDVCPLRMLSEQEDFLREKETNSDLILIDVAKKISELSRDGIPGNEWLVDHVHPSIAGHQKIAAELYEAMALAKWVVPESGTEARRDQAIRTHQRTLDEAYYQRGQQRLRGLQRWTQGRAKAISPEMDVNKEN